MFGLLVAENRQLVGILLPQGTRPRCVLTQHLASLFNRPLAHKDLCFRKRQGCPTLFIQIGGAQTLIKSL